MPEWVPNFRSAHPLQSVLDIARKVRRRVWSARTFMILRCELSRLGEPPSAKIPIEMQPVEPAKFTGFEEELSRVPRSEIPDLLSREKLRRRSVQGLYTAFSDSGDPIFSQWLMRAGQANIPESILRAPLRDDEVLIEGAYTFSRYRGMGAMTAGMYQLLAFARDDGYRRAFTGVGIDNVPSLRGCHHVGFELDYIRRSTGRLGVYRRRYRPPRPEEAARWREAIGS